MDSSLLGRLSPELRNLIYGYSLAQLRPIRFCMPGATGKVQLSHASYTELSSGQSSVQLLALSMTCKQIHNECTSLFYAINDFVAETLDEDIWDSDDNREIIVRFCKVIGRANVRALRSLTLDTDGASECGDEPSIHQFFQAFERVDDALEAITVRIGSYSSRSPIARLLVLHLLRLQRRFAGRHYSVEFGLGLTRSLNPQQVDLLAFHLQLHKPKEEAERLRSAATITETPNHREWYLRVAAWLEVSFAIDYWRLPPDPYIKDWQDWLEPA